MKIIILAGGEGTRLRPYTTVLPKPLMPLGDKPILEHIIERLASQGLREITLSVGYLSGLIEAYFGDGSQLGVSLYYVREEEALGTVGPVRLIESPNKPFLVMNGDILTDLDFSAFTEFHASTSPLLTVATYEKEVKIDLGVLSLKGNDITGYSEKPVLRYPVSMGIYCCSPAVLNFIPQDTRFDLPDLVNALLRKSKAVQSFHHRGYWLDIGRHEDYEHAQDDLARFIIRADTA